MDNFKQINDQLGHQFGDIVLKEFADLLKREIRSKDLAVRWGGDEFLVCLVDANEEEAKEFLTRIKLKTERFTINRKEDLVKIKKKLPKDRECSLELVKNKINNLSVSGGTLQSYK